MIKLDVPIKGSKILVKGITFKENVPDIRNSKVIDIINELKEYGINVLVEDVYAEKEEVEKEYKIELQENVKDVDVIVFAVAHNEYKETSVEDMKTTLKDDRNLIIDIKAMFDKEKLEKEGLKVWRL